MAEGSDRHDCRLGVLPGSERARSGVQEPGSDRPQSDPAPLKVSGGLWGVSWYQASGVLVSEYRS